MHGLFGGFFKDKKIFVTGHTGFIGTWLVTWLYSLGAKVTGYSLEPNTTPSMFDEINLTSNITHIIGDVNDVDFLQKNMSKTSPDIVFHLAAQPIVSLS